MTIKWIEVANKELTRNSESELSELYHENSKLFSGLAYEIASGLTLNPFELKITSRGFRQFNNAESINLPDIQKSEVALQAVLTSRRSRRDISSPVSLETFATILGQSLGITGIVENSELGTIQYLRAYPSAGGLYPLDVYVVASGITDLSNGVYHYNIITHQLEPISGRTVSDVLNDGFFRQEFIASCAAVVIFVASFSRSKTKYGERGYRLTLLDIGHAAENVLLSAEQMGIKAVPIAGFCDDSLANDLNIDGVNEAVVHCVCMGN